MLHRKLNQPTQAWVQSSGVSGLVAIYPLPLAFDFLVFIQEHLPPTIVRNTIDPTYAEG
jgi:hypothetical protein